MKLIKRSYDEGYHDTLFYQEKDNSHRNRERLRLLLSHKPGRRLLEVGCGEAGFLRLAENHFDVEGIDISKTAIRAIQPHFKERVRVLNIEQKQLPGSRYDVIVAFNILEHLNQPNKAAHKLNTALAPGGMVLGSVPHNANLVGSLMTRLGNFIDRTHQSTFTPDTWRRIFTHAGFKQIHFFGEINFGRNHCRYLTGQFWPFMAFNLMFILKKEAE